MSAVLARQQARIRAMTPEEKLRASDALRTAAWALKEAWIRARHPDLSDVEIRDAVRQWFRDATA